MVRFQEGAMAALPPLPVGIQDFEKLRRRGCLYVDKTPYLHKLLQSTNEAFFLARPRRFGKSLFISTLEAVVCGRRELFQGLWIDSIDYDWPIYPTIRLDMSRLTTRSIEECSRSFQQRLEEIGANYGIVLPHQCSPQDMLDALIVALHAKHGKVVILVDEYDKPLLDNLNDSLLCREMRRFFQGVYSIIKAQGHYLRFVFLTGITRFSTMSIFSGLNNFNDLSLDGAYATLLGYTQKELDRYFTPHLEELQLQLKLTPQQCQERIREWYNGYCFSENLSEKVYNPFSVLMLFEKKKFLYHWYQTATPGFLMELVRTQKIIFAEDAPYQLSWEAFGAYDIDCLAAIPLMVDTGYLTIVDYDEQMQLFTLEYPNREVKHGFFNMLLQQYAAVQATELATLYRLRVALEQVDLAAFFHHLRVFFANIPYEIQLDNERYYQSIFYLLLTLLGMFVEVEVSTNNGRIDALVRTKRSLFLFEFKLRGSKEEALAQMMTKDYPRRYSHASREIWLVGAAFDQKTRTILDDGWIAQLWKPQAP